MNAFSPVENTPCGALQFLVPEISTTTTTTTCWMISTATHTLRVMHNNICVTCISHIPLHLYRSCTILFFKAKVVFFFDKCHRDQGCVWVVVKKEKKRRRKPGREKVCCSACIITDKGPAGGKIRHTVRIVLTWQASHVHFLQVFGLEDDHGQLAGGGNVSQREADIAQLLLLLDKQKHRRGEF